MQGFDLDSFMLGLAVGSALMCAIWVVALKYFEKG